MALQNLQVNLRLEPGKSISFFAALGTSTVKYRDQSFLSKFLYFVAMQINKHTVQIFEVLCGFETIVDVGPVSSSVEFSKRMQNWGEKKMKEI